MMMKPIFKIKEILELRGIEIIFDIRKDSVGGGTAVAVCSEKYSISGINTPRVHGIEVTVALVK